MHCEPSKKHEKIISAIIQSSEFCMIAISKNIFMLWELSMLRFSQQVLQCIFHITLLFTLYGRKQLYTLCNTTSRKHLVNEGIWVSDSLLFSA